MRGLWLLSSVAVSAAWAGAAQAQVSVPLPGGRTPPPAPGPPASNVPPPSAPTLSPGTPVPLPNVGQPNIATVPIGVHGRPDINPYERDIDMTVPLLYRGRSMGDMSVQLTHDDQFFIDTQSFLRLINPLLSIPARAGLATRLGSRRTFTAEDLSSTGVSLDYDPASLAIVVLAIDPGKRAIERLFTTPAAETEAPDLMPAHFSGYLNLNIVQSYYWQQGNNGPPSVALNGAVRLGGFVFEGEGQFGDDNGLSGNSGGYGFDRNYARIVYDQPAQFRRWMLGDLSPELRGQQGYVQIGGLGVIRQRRRFNDYQSAVLQGNRQLILQDQSTVRIIRNGVLYRELRLEAGSYDFSSLPLLTGSNDVQIEVRGNNGFVQNISYQSYLDPIDLEPGDYEYAAYLGRTSNRLGSSPTYGGPMAFSGFFRKAFLNRPAIGIGVQASRRVQNLTGQTQFVIGNGSRILVDGGLSHSRDVGAGFSAGLSFDQIIDRAGLIDSFSIRADYLSKHYSGLGNPTALNPSALNLSAQYTRAINPRLTLLASGTYIKNRDSHADSYRLAALANYNITREWSVRAGADYTRYPGFTGRSSNIGVNVAIVFQPNYRSRAEARYDSAIDSARLSYNRSGSNEIGSIGYGATVGRESGQLNAAAFADYTGNRFDGSISHATYGNSLSSFGSQNVTSVRIGTSIAFADGHFGVGRRISDSFAILYPHDNLRSHQVVAGQSLANNQYISRSGTFGGAVNNFLTSYTIQSVQYDVQDPPVGYDVGPGVVRVRPPYRSGYSLRIGTDAFVSATGTVVLPNREPLSLAGGRVTPMGDPAGASVPFFTNSVGRFAIANLVPGRRYRVEIYGRPNMFEFDVPRDTSGLVNLNTVVLVPAN